MNKLLAIEAFRQVVEQGSFVAAAREMEISAPMATKHISQLEQHLGVRLLTRSTRSVRLTEQGEQYHQSICAILDELASAEQRAQASSQSPTGTLRLTAPAVLGEQLLPAIINEFLSRYPNIRLAVDLTDRQVDLFSENYDLAVRAGNLDHPDLVAKKFAQLPLSICASPNYIASNPAIEKPADLGEHNCLLNPNIEAASLWRFVKNGKPIVQRVAANLSINSLEMLVQACVQGTGVLYAPRMVMDSHIAKGELVEVLTDYTVPPMAVYFVYPERHYLPAKVRCFLDTAMALIDT